MATFQVVNTLGSGPGTLHRAINLANDSPGADTITFNIPGDGNHQIPVIGFYGTIIKGKVTIDGYTQPGSARNTSADPAVNNARITVSLKNTAPPGPGLVVWGRRASGSQLRGLSFVNADPYGSQSGIEVRNADYVTIDGCAFTSTGRARLSQAVIIRNADHNTIGGNVDWTPALQNVMSRYDVGVELIGSSQHNAIVSNLIGGEPEQSENPIQKVGVLIQRSSRNNTIARNILFKNITPLRIESTNVIEDNTIVPR
ncbi:MAG: NosD domain-containing protein [Isosphaeraceae bacterium]